MWLILAFLSAALLGCYDSFKKNSLLSNAVIPVLFLNTLFSSLIFIPFILLSGTTNVLDGSIFHVASGGWEVHRYILLKAVIVLASWIFGYFGMKHHQWIGVVLAIISFFMLSRSGKKEGIDFKHDVWIYFIVLAAMLGAVSGLYDKYLMAPADEGGIGLDRMMVQAWYNIYQCGLMLVCLLLLWAPVRHRTTPFHWSWSIILVSIFLSSADFVYFYSLSIPGAMISIVSMVRRGSVAVSFLFGAMVFHEKNLRSKALDLLLVLLGLLFLYIGTEYE